MRTYERRAEGEDVAEGVQDMHAPHSGGGEFPTHSFCFIDLFVPILTARREVGLREGRGIQFM